MEEARGPGNAKTTWGRHFLVKALEPPPTTFQIRYVFTQKGCVFSTLVLKNFPAVVLVGHELFPALNKI